MSWPSTPGPTNYQHPFPNYQLNDLHQAMDYNAAGEPIIRVATYPGSESSTFGTADAFGRGRVATPYTLFDSAFLGGDNGFFDTATSGTASASWQAYQSVIDMTVGTASGDEVIRQSKRVFPYQPGKSLEIFNSFCFNTPKTNLRQRVGYFTAYNGVYFEADGTTLNLVIRKQTGASTYTEDRVSQTNWNNDPLNGTGTSGITLDPSLVQIFYCDIEWLGVGSVRCGFIINGVFILAHTFNHANVAGNTTTYMESAQQSIRLEITNTGTTASSSTMKQICCSVISCGGYENVSVQNSAGRGLTYYTMSTAGTFYNLVSLRLTADGLDKCAVPDAIAILTDSNQNMQYRIILNPTFSGALTWTSSTTFVESTTSNVTVTGGTVISTGFIVNKGEPATLSGLNPLAYQLGRTIAGVSDILCIAVTADSNNVKLGGDISWIEF